MPAQFTTTRGRAELLDHGLDRGFGVAGVGDVGLDVEAAQLLGLGSPSSSCRSKIATLAPAAASADAVAPPKPDAPPVTMAAWPLTFIGIPPWFAALFSRSQPLAKRGRMPTFQAMSDTDRLLQDETRVRDGFWRKARQTLGKVPFTEDAVAAFYCALDSATPLPIRATLFGALAYFVMPFDAIPDFIVGPGLHRRCGDPDRRLHRGAGAHHRGASRKGARLAPQGAGVSSGLGDSAARRRSRASWCSRWAM